MSRLTLPAVGLLEACDDRSLFGASIELWPMQRRLLEGVAENRLSVWALGRRSGKSTSAALALTWCCLLRPELLERLRPGERGVAMIVATNARQGRLILRAATEIVQASPVLSSMVESVLEDELVFVNGTSIFAAPCSSRAGRGWPLIALCLDEAAHLATETEGHQAAARVWEALAPGTAQFAEHARIVIASTPFGDQGLFPDLFNRVAGGELPGIAFQAGTRECNPSIPEEFLESERLRDPTSFEAEYGASFLEGGGAYVPASAIAAATADRGELSPRDCERWAFGFDPSFSSDPAGLVGVGWNPDGSLRVGVVHSFAPPKAKLTTLEARRDREDEVLARVADIVRPFGGRILTDQFMAMSVADALTRRGCSVEVVNLGAASKTSIFGQMRARLLDGTLELFGHPALIADLRALRTKFTAGSSHVVTPRVNGSHCDTAVSLSLAIHHFDRFGVQRGTPGNRRPNERDTGTYSRGLIGRVW